MPQTTRLEIVDGARVSNIKPAKVVDVCDFFLETDRLLQRTATPEDEEGNIFAFDMTVGQEVPVPGDTEVDVVEEIQIKYIND